jgi:hypothetical protein
VSCFVEKFLLNSSRHHRVEKLEGRSGEAVFHRWVDVVRVVGFKQTHLLAVQSACGIYIRESNLS